jgi:hypothetical protein
MMLSMGIFAKKKQWRSDWKVGMLGCCAARLSGQIGRRNDVIRR